MRLNNCKRDAFIKSIFSIVEAEVESWFSAKQRRNLHLSNDFAVGDFMTFELRKICKMYNVLNDVILVIIKSSRRLTNCEWISDRVRRVAVNPHKRFVFLSAFVRK